jgi:hypothetical protein
MTRLEPRARSLRVRLHPTCVRARPHQMLRAGVGATVWLRVMVCSRCSMHRGSQPAAGEVGRPKLCRRSITTTVPWRGTPRREPLCTRSLRAEQCMQLLARHVWCAPAPAASSACSCCWHVLTQPLTSRAPPEVKQDWAAEACARCHGSSHQAEQQQQQQQQAPTQHNARVSSARLLCGHSHGRRLQGLVKVDNRVLQARHVRVMWCVVSPPGPRSPSTPGG